MLVKYANFVKIQPIAPDKRVRPKASNLLVALTEPLLRSTLGERFVIFGDPVVDGIPVHARREDSRFLVTWTGDVQNLRHFE